MADELLASPGAGDRGSLVVGVGAGADDRHVADAADPLVHRAAGRGGGRQVAVAVHGHRADRAELRGAALAAAGARVAGVVALGIRRSVPTRGPARPLAPDLPKALQLGLGREVGLDVPLDAGRHREVVGALAAEEDVGRVLHHAPGEPHRVADVPHAGHRAAGQGAAVHDRGVEFVGADGGEDRAAAGVEPGVVLQRGDDVLDHAETRFAGLQLLAAQGQRLAQGPVVVLGVRRVAASAAGAAVDGERPLGRRRRLGPGFVRLIHVRWLFLVGSGFHRAARPEAYGQGREDSGVESRGTQPRTVLHVPAPLGRREAWTADTPERPGRYHGGAAGGGA